MIITAFVLGEDASIEMHYPAVENGWTHRPDLSHASVHRWDYGDRIRLVARHTSCTNSVRASTTLCRNCVMKKVWRKQCTNVKNQYYIYAPSMDELAPLLLRMWPLKKTIAEGLASGAPKMNPRQQKRDSSAAWKIRMTYAERHMQSPLGVTVVATPVSKNLVTTTVRSFE